MKKILIILLLTFLIIPFSGVKADSITAKNVDAIPLSHTKMKLIWETDYTAGNSILYYRNSGDSSWKNQTASCYPNSGQHECQLIISESLSPGEIYYYKFQEGNNISSQEYSYFVMPEEINIYSITTLLNNNNPTVVNIEWHTEINTYSKIIYYPVNNIMDQHTVEDYNLTYDHVLTLSNLQPDTEYEYQITSLNQEGAGVVSDWFDMLTFTTPAELTNKPDLTLEDIYYQNNLLKFKYCNRGTNTQSGIFYVKLDVGGNVYDGETGNGSYPFNVPSVGECKTSDGYPVSLFNLTKEDTFHVKAEIDYNDLIDEKNENNNTYSEYLYIGNTSQNLTCNNLENDSTKAQYFNSCKNSGYNYVCFNKHTGVYQGCTNSSVGCTSSNINSNYNILCNAKIVSNSISSINVFNVEYVALGDKISNIKSVNDDEYELSHILLLDNLIPGTTYQYNINGISNAGETYNLKSLTSSGNGYYFTTQNNPTCFDTDGGKNYYQKGTCNGVASWGKSIPASSISDSCSSSKQLTELWCGSDGYIYQESYICPNGCHEGACIQIAEKPKASSSTPSGVAKRLKGRLLLGVQQGGAIWFVDDINYQRHQVNWGNALPLFQKFALGITDEDLLKIPVTLESIRFELDTDGDGYSDRTELENGYSPYVAGSYKGKFTIDKTFANRLKGKFLLQVNQGGAIWYVDQNGIRHNVRWDNLMPLFEALALGINNTDLGQIESGD